jgi:hypothetical protein
MLYDTSATHISMFKSLQYDVLECLTHYSMVAMGDLHYWGARGVVRDHARALRYFDQVCCVHIHCVSTRCMYSVYILHTTPKLFTD